MAEGRTRNSPSTLARAWAQTPALTDGEIRKVDKDAKKLTIKHGPMPALDMPAMTMVPVGTGRARRNTVLATVTTIAMPIFLVPTPS